MSRRVCRLTVDDVALLPAAHRDCLFWELDAVARRAVGPAEAMAEKEAWVSTVLREWGVCGVVVLADGRPVGHALFAPPAFVPGAAAVPTAPASPDAVLLTALHVDPAHRGGGLGRMLVQGVARELAAKHVGAVEAFGTTSSRERDPHLVPADFLGSVGFKTQRAHVTTPRMRMELRTARTWRAEVEAAWERLRGAVRPVSAPSLPETGRTQMYSSSSLSSAALGRAPTMVFTTSPPE